MRNRASRGARNPRSRVSATTSAFARSLLVSRCFCYVCVSLRLIKPIQYISVVLINRSEPSFHMEKPGKALAVVRYGRWLSLILYYQPLSPSSTVWNNAFENIHSAIYYATQIDGLSLPCNHELTYHSVVQ
jgi:hypothetical protein